MLTKSKQCFSIYDRMTVGFQKKYDYLLLVTSNCNETGLSKLPAGMIIWGVSLVQVPRNNDRDPEVPEIQKRILTARGNCNKKICLTSIANNILGEED